MQRTPRHMVIIGGGIIGLCAAYELRRRGWDVTLLDAGAPGAAASQGNAGWIVPALSGPVPAPGLVKTSLRWMLRSDSPLYIKPRADLEFARWLLTFWRKCNTRDYRAGLEATAALNQRTMALFDQLRADGVAFEMHQDGLLFAYQSPADLEHDLRDLDLLRSFGYELPAPLMGDAVRELEPALSSAVAGGFWLRQERHVRPETLTAGLLAHLSAKGVELHANTPAVGIDHKDGRVTAVQTPKGRVEADNVLICAGAWTAHVARLAGVRVPIQAGKGYSLDYAPPPRPVRHALYLHEARVAVTPFAGAVRLAGTMEFSGLNERILPKRVAAIARAGHGYLQDWPADPAEATAWTGMRPLTPDGLPVIGLAPRFRNLAIASGHAMLGLTLAPATAEAIAELITTGSVPDVLLPFDPARFGGGR